MLTQHDKIWLAAKAIVSPKTVDRVYAGGGNDFSRKRVGEAARALGFPDPPARSSEAHRPTAA